MKTFLFLILIISISFANQAKKTEAPNWRPVVLMHGLLASQEAMSHAAVWIQQDFPGIYVHNVEIGNGRQDSMFMEINHQVDLLAQAVRNDPKLKQGFNMIGHSQGGLLTRAYIERYNNPPVYNYISWAGPMDGVYGTPDFNYYCPDSYCPWLNDLMNAIMDGAWSDDWMQEHIAFSTYWKDPFNYDLYLQKNNFLADINNEKSIKNSTYKKNFSSLNQVLLVYSELDQIVIPQTSPWFQFYQIGSDTQIVQWNQSDLYSGDWIGLQTLNKSGKLTLKGIQCDHQSIPRDECKKWYDMYTRPLLNNTLG